jgi:PAS domain S-box-containing protein
MAEPAPLDILVIEDDPDTRDNLTDLLTLDDHRVQCAGSVAEALVDRDWGRISLILLDRQLPDGTAENVLPRLKERAPEAEVLIVTGYSDLEGALACIRKGAADYIVKPLNPEVLRADIQRVAQQQAMARQVRLLATAVRDVKEGILITDALLEKPGPHILFVNDALVRMTGYTQEQLLGNTPRILQSAHTDRATLDHLKNALLHGKAFTGDVINRRRDGSEYHVELHVSPVFDRAGRVINYVATQRDITARKQSEERLLQAERLAAIGQMVTGLAHESRNALQRSKACLELLAMELEDRPESLDLVARIHKAQNHLHQLYEEVRGYAAPIHLQRDVYQLEEVWRDVWRDLEVARESKKVVLREMIQSDHLQVKVDAFALGQVFRNIFENAIAACANPGEILVTASDARLGDRPAVRVSIRDDGPGLNLQQATHIFDPFYTTKTRGTGLGMAISRRIVSAHSGEIEVAGAGQPGAEIIVTLPR